MALINTNKLDSLKHLDTGLRINTNNLPNGEDGKPMRGAKEEGEKAIVVMPQPGGRIKQKRHSAGWWPDEKKIEVATLYVALGSVKKVSELAKVPKTTVERWMSEDWFYQTLQRVRREEGAVTDVKFTKIVDKALDKLMERIDNGDAVYDIKRGTVAMLPVSARDLSMVTGIIFDKRQLLRGEATKIVASSTSEEHLKKLAHQFADYVKSKEKVVNLLETTDDLQDADPAGVGSAETIIEEGDASK